jgi:hypothetical protein
VLGLCHRGGDGANSDGAGRTLRRGAEHTAQIEDGARPNPHPLSSPLDIDKRHSQVAEPLKPEIAKEVEVRVWALIFGLPNETDVTRFADHYIAGEVDANGEAFTMERVAEKVRDLLGGDEPLEAYIPFLQRCLDDKRAEGMQVEAAS